MKIQFTKRDTADTLSMDGNVLTQNGVEYDLENVPEYIAEDGTTAPAVYKDSDGMVHILTTVDADRFFLAMGGKFKDADGTERTYHNYMIYHDADLNGDIDIEELKSFVDVFNMSSEDRREFHRNKFAEFSGGKRLSQLSDAKRIEWLMKGVEK